MTYPTIRNAEDLSRVVSDILSVYLSDSNFKHEAGIASVRQIPMTQCTTQLLGPGCSIRLATGQEFHVCFVAQHGSGVGGRWIDTTTCGE